MRRVASNKKLGLFLASVAAFWASNAHAALVTQGNILVSGNHRIREYTRGGSLVQTITMDPHEFDDSRDVVYAADGKLLVFDGTFTPRLATYDPFAGWTYNTFPGWSTVNNVSFGGIATFGRYVYVSDNITANDGGTSGIVRFDRLGGPTLRTITGRDAIDVVIGLDGYLYTLNGTGSPSGSIVSVWELGTMAFVRDVSIGHINGQNRGLSVDYDGSFFIATWDNKLVHTSPTGAFIKELVLPTANPSFTNNYQDVDLAPDGSILVGQRFGSVVLTNRTLTSATAFMGTSGSTSESFVAFAVDPVPEPSTAFFAALGGLLLLRRRRA